MAELKIISMDEVSVEEVEWLAECGVVAEKLKAENQMLWVQKMNNIRNRATEIVHTSLCLTGKAAGRNPCRRYIGI